MPLIILQQIIGNKMVNHFVPILMGGRELFCNLHVYFQHVDNDHVEIKLSRCDTDFNFRLFCGRVKKPKIQNPQNYPQKS